MGTSAAPRFTNEETNGMTGERRHFAMKAILVLALLISGTGYVDAATRSTFVIEIIRGSKTERQSEVITIDGNKARMDFLGADGKKTVGTPFMVTNDGGKTWLLVDKDDNKTVCTEWNTREFFNAMGGFMTYVSELANAEVKEAKVDIILDEPGPEMLGYTTRHVRLNSAIRIKARILFFTYEYALNIKDDVWMSPDLALHPIEKAWIDALTRTGSVEIDRMSKAWNEKVPGTIFKQVSVVTLRNVKKDEEKTKTEKIELTKMEQLMSEDIPEDTFKMPKCKKVSESAMEDAAEDMLKSVIK